MTATDTAALAQRLYDAFNQSNFDQAVAMATDDIEVVFIPFSQTFRGHAGFRSFMEGFKTAFPNLTVTVTNQVAIEDQVVSECTWRGTHTGPLQSPAGDLPATGRTVEGGRFCEVWGIRDGKIASLRNYQDVASWLRQLGLAP